MKSSAPKKLKFAKRESGYTGVSWQTGKMCWFAQIEMSGKKVVARFFAKDYLEPDQKLSSHRFAHPESAIEKARLAAIDWRKEKEEEKGGKKRRRTNNTSKYEKISWLQRDKAYCAKLFNGPGGRKVFRVSVCGSEAAALAAAVEWRDDQINHGNVKKSCEPTEVVGVVKLVNGSYMAYRQRSGVTYNPKDFQDHKDPDKAAKDAAVALRTKCDDIARLDAIKWRKEKEEEERGGEKRRKTNSSGHEKISWHKAAQGYEVRLWREKGGSKLFTIKSFGDADAALAAAIKWRDDQISSGNLKKSSEPTDFVGVCKLANGSYKAQIEQCGEKREVTYHPKDFQDHADPDKAAKDAAVAWRTEYENSARADSFEAFKSNPAPASAKWVCPCDDVMMWLDSINDR